MANVDCCYSCLLTVSGQPVSIPVCCCANLVKYKCARKINLQASGAVILTNLILAFTNTIFAFRAFSGKSLR